MIPKIPIRKALNLLNTQISQGIEIRNALADFMGRPTATKLEIKEVMNKLDIWFKNSLSALKNIFEDLEPVSRFINFPTVGGRPETMPKEVGDAWRGFLLQMNILGDIYRDLEKQTVAPLHFVESQSLIRNFDTVCPMGPGTLQFSLVKYMFGNHDFEELVDVDVVYPQVKSDIDKKLNTSDVHQWAKEINKKTRVAFGFPIFFLPAGKIALTYPHPPS